MFRDTMFGMVRANPQHIFIVFTKRAANMQAYCTGGRIERPYEPRRRSPHVLPNLILGVSCCTQAEIETNVPLLLDTPAACRAVALEPWLGVLPLMPAIMDLDWVIYGCESRPSGRVGRLAHTEAAFVRHATVVQSYRVNTPCYIKQLPVNGRVSTDPKEWPDNPNGWARQLPSIGATTC
jgi:protein gp37